MKFHVEFDCDNAAFGDPDSLEFGAEVSTVLHEVADRMESGYTFGLCRDSNGNTVGRFWVGPSPVQPYTLGKTDQEALTIHLLEKEQQP